MTWITAGLVGYVLGLATAGIWMFVRGGQEHRRADRLSVVRRPGDRKGRGW